MFILKQSVIWKIQNRREDGAIIGLGYSVNEPMTQNGNPMRFLYY